VISGQQKPEIKIYCKNEFLFWIIKELVLKYMYPGFDIHDRDEAKIKPHGIASRHFYGVNR
jgi:hypothetical protein